MIKSLNFLYLVLLLSLFHFGELFAQAKVRKLSTIINHPSLNIYAPFISADANALVFISDNAEDQVLTPFFSFRHNNDWQEPQVLPKAINTRMNFLRGYGLSADGGTLLFSSLKTPGVGGFDLWFAEWKGSVWSVPQNFGAPINSRAHEACPSVTPDGKTMYFMRCDRMDQLKGEGCKIVRVDKKSNGQWGEPVEMPANINTGNSQTPRIMADAETLIFSSDKMGSKGGMDLFMTRFQNGQWTDPLPLDFVNTEKDDQYVSVTGLGRYLLRDSQGSRRSELVEYLIPQELRPAGMMKIDGKVTDINGQNVPAYISMVDTNTGARIYNGRPNSDGTFLIYAREGTVYELAIDPEHADKTFFSRKLDLTRDPIPQIEKVHAVLAPLKPGDEVELSGIKFQDFSKEIDMRASDSELKRLTRMVTGNPDLKFEIHIMLEGYVEDSIQSDPDLTEVAIDTVLSTFIDIDTLGQLFERDSMMVEVRYHNDRTIAQAEALIGYLAQKGAHENNLSGFVTAVPATLPDQRRTIVKAVVKM